MINFKDLQTDDNYDLEDVILISYKKLRTDQNEHIVTLKDNFCSYVKSTKYYDTIFNQVVNSRDIFKLIYDSGKEHFSNYKTHFNLQFSTNNLISLDDMIINSMQDNEFNEELISSYNNWIFDNGYPYESSFEKTITFSLPSFIKDSIYLYVFYDIHKWIWKITNKKNEGFHHEKRTVTYPTHKFEFLISLIKDDLINALYETNNPYIQFEEDISCIQVGNLLRTEKFDYENRNTYFMWIKMGLIAYIYNKFVKEKRNYFITKQFPIYNASSKCYRSYYSATSLIGIAYNYLFLNLTSNTVDYRTKICSNPMCINEFVRKRNVAYCPKCLENNVPRKIKSKKYEMNSRGIPPEKRKVNQN